MKKFLFSFAFAAFFLPGFSQTITNKLTRAYHQFEKDAQLSNAIISLYVIDGKTGRVVFDRNSKIGLAPASTQKIITAATAYELLGQEFLYNTEFGYTGTIEGNNLNGSIYIKASGDPTLGSWRWKQTSENEVMSRVVASFKKTGIAQYRNLVIDQEGWEGESIPDGWIWQDIGNYYGAGAEVLNWRENQYDLILQSGKNIGDKVMIKGTNPYLYHYDFNSYVISAAKGTGDRSYIYLPVNSKTGIVRGTIPIGQDKFLISGAMPSPKFQLASTLIDSLSKYDIRKQEESAGPITMTAEKPTLEKVTIIHREQSPSLDSIVYWFLRKSINLYGEALVKTMAAKNREEATTVNGVNLLKDFWKGKGIAAGELNMSDGSGLSPLNRVTTHAQVQVLKYAKDQPWFKSYFDAFPEYNKMKMKSGTISDVKSFCGYHRSSTGQEYIFSFIVNNYNGSSSTLVQKMYAVLDELK